ncbi:MAG: hypothetical protein KBB32_11730 [Spirochaetia bacterium]|nr:hypothetical protein [Spirochaetia bacterium]
MTAGTKRALALAASMAAGLGLWAAARYGVMAAGSVSPLWPAWAAVVLRAGVEEILRLGLALLAGTLVATTGSPRSWVLYGVLASAFMGLAENLSYLAAFPTADVYWRLGYALPVHVNAAAAYALALELVRRSGRLWVPAAALGLGLGWHALFNLAATYTRHPAVPAAGSALNLALMLGLAMAAGLWAHSVREHPSEPARDRHTRSLP